MATFKQLQDRVRTNVIDLPQAVADAIPTLVNQAIEELERRRSWKVMETEACGNTTVATRGLGSMPADFKEWRSLARPYYKTQAGGDKPVELLANRDDALRRYSFNDPTDKGPPRALTWITADNAGLQTLEVWPFPDGLSDWTSAPAGEYRIVMPYHKFLPVLAADGDTNWFTVRGDLWLEYQATGMAFLKDWDEQRAASWFALAAATFPALRRLDAAMQSSVSRVLMVRSDVDAPRNQERK